MQEAPSTEDEMFSRIFAYVDRIVDVVQPQKLLYLAIGMFVELEQKLSEKRLHRVSFVRLHLIRNYG